MRMTATLLVLLAVLVGGCADGPEGLTVLAASSLHDVAGALLSATDTPGDVSGAGSHTLAAQVEAGAPGDVLLLADPAVAHRLEEAGLAEPPVEVARTTLVVAVAPDAADRVLRAQDLADADLRIVLGDEDVPVGRYTREAFRSLERSGAVPPGTLDRILEGADSFEAESRGVLVKLVSGEADAVVVYRSDLTALAGQVETVPLPDAPEVVYTAQVLTGTDDPDGARRFVAALTDGATGDTWRRFGLRPAAFLGTDRPEVP